jgi:hypothetical protein
VLAMASKMPRARRNEKLQRALGVPSVRRHTIF